MKNVNDQMRELAADASARFVEHISATDPDAIVAALGGVFETTEQTIQGGHKLLILVGANRREAVISMTGKVVNGDVAIYEPRVRVVR